MLNSAPNRNHLHLLSITALFAGAITVMTAYMLHIPIPTGGYIHLGDALIYLGAAFLPRPYALAAAAIGGGTADILTVPVWAPATVIIKMLIVLPFTSKEGRILCTRNIAAPFLAAVISAAGYYLAEGILFGSFAAPLASLAGSAVQSGGSAVIFLTLAAALDKMHMKSLAKQMLGL